MMMPRSRVNLDIDLVRSFVTIVSLGNFTRAAQALGLQQSTISLQIRRLEEQIGGKLLERSPQSVALTAEGETFFDYARRMLDLNDEMVARLQEPAMRGLVRLGAPEDFATRHLPDVLARFAQAYPQVDLEVTCDLTMNLIERFRKGAFDLALIKRERSIEIPGTRVWREPLVWVTGGLDLREGCCRWLSRQNRASTGNGLPRPWIAPGGPGGSPTPAVRWRGLLPPCAPGWA
jgi:DNA-binding transcriptional LysR family regulator